MIRTGRRTDEGSQILSCQGKHVEADWKKIQSCIGLSVSEEGRRKSATDGRVMTGERDLTAGVRGWSRGIPGFMSSRLSTEVCKYFQDFTWSSCQS